MLYYLEQPGSLPLNKVKQISLQDSGWTEKDLENLLAENMERVVRTDQLFVIMQERRMQEEADIMALDKDGTLYLFELKRWRGSEDNLLQVLRYGQRFGRYEYDRLESVFNSYQRRRRANESNPSLDEAHRQYFSLDSPLPRNAFNKRQRFVVVTNGLDRATYDALQYWRGYHLPLESLVYRIYREDRSNRVLIDFDPYGPEPGSSDTEEDLFVVNTNWTYDRNAYLEMLQKEKASAYFDRKWSVAAIRRGNSVCLFHVGVGVIAIGKAKSDYCKASYDGEADSEFYVPCHFDYKVDPIKQPNLAVKASEINEQFNTGHRFRQTVFSLPMEFATFIRQKFDQKQKAIGNG